MFHLQLEEKYAFLKKSMEENVFAGEKSGTEKRKRSVFVITIHFRN